MCLVLARGVIMLVTWIGQGWTELGTKLKVFFVMSKMSDANFY